MKTDMGKHSGRKGVITGVIIIILGVIWLLDEIGLYIPDWLFDWEMILIYIGILVGLSKGFNNPGPWILIGIGGVFLIDDLVDFPFEIFEYFWPLLVITIGLIIVFRKRNRKFSEDDEDFTGQVYDRDGVEYDRTRRIDSVAIFNGVKKLILSKEFLGGETVTVFGGTEINLLQADFSKPIELEAVVVFGGLKLIIPRNWEVRSNVTSILAGVSDKRVSAIEVIPDEKVLLITGVVIFGGIDIVSY